MDVAGLLKDWSLRVKTLQARSGLRLAMLVRIGVLWGALLLASMLGLLAPVDGWLFDRLATLPPRPTLAAQVAVVRYPPPGSRDAGQGLEALVAALREAGAAAVVVVSTPTTFPAAPFAGQPARASSAAVAGVDATLAPDAPGSGCQPSAETGVARSLPLTGVRRQACLITRIAARLGLELPAGARLSPDFSIQSATALPTLRSEQAGSPTLLKLSVAGRTVLLYPEPDPAVHATPLYASDGLMESSVLHALALDSLLRQRAVRWVPAPLDVLLALVVTALLLWRLRRAPHRAALAWAAVAALLVVLLGAGLLRLAHVYLPVTATLLALLAFVLRDVVSRNVTLTRTLVDVEHQLTGLVQRPLAASFDLTGEVAWEHVNRFVVQMFDLQRSVMLQLPAGTFHLQPASWIDCLPGSIVEKRKDYRRTPYLSAIAAGRPIRVDKPFFRAGEGLVDFLAPLIVAERLVGFWAFSAKAAPPAELEALMHEAAPYADEVAKVAFRASEAPGRDDPGTSRRFLSVATTRSRLLGVAQLAKEQLAAYRDVFVAVGHPIAVTDLFGRIQFSNLSFEQYANAIGRPLLAMSIHNILTQLCRLSPVEAKRMVRQTLARRRGEEAGLPVEILDAPVAYSLHLKPVLRQGTTPAGAMASPFDVIGLVVELSPTVNPEISLAEITRTSSVALRRMVAGLDSLVRIADGLPGDVPQRHQMTDQLQMLWREAEQLHTMFAQPHPDQAEVEAVVDVERLLERARHEVIQAATDKSVDIVIEDAPPLLVVISLKPMRALLADVLALLIDDAHPGTSIRIAAKLSPDQTWVGVRFANAGYGLPESHVADVMRHGQADPATAVGDASLLDRVAQHARQLDPGLSLQLTTRLGEGFVAELRLPGTRNRK